MLFGVCFPNCLLVIFQYVHKDKTLEQGIYRVMQLLVNTL